MLILAGSPSGNATRARFSRVKGPPPAKRNANLYLVVGCLLLVVEAAYFWFDVDVFSAATYR